MGIIADAKDYPGAVASAAHFLESRMILVAYKYAFVGEILLIMKKEPTRHIQTMGVGVKGSEIFLLYNPNFILYFRDKPDNWIS